MRVHLATIGRMRWLLLDDGGRVIGSYKTAREANRALDMCTADDTPATYREPPIWHPAEEEWFTP